jgi:hypothetical protein
MKEGVVEINPARVMNTIHKEREGEPYVVLFDD